jgi:CDP-diacylglycerol--serine O-phosphatidyltransferase
MSDLFPPVDHESLRTGRRFGRLRSVPFRVVLPNLVTLLSLCAGLTSIRMALEENFGWAVAAVVFAAALDGIDGRVARWLKGTSRFGAELDSLADFVNFGVVPGLLLYIWVLKDAGSFGWIAVLAHVIAMGLRLARFNVALDTPKPAWAGNFFVGMPAPAGAMTVLLPLYVTEIFPIGHGISIAGVVAVYTLFIAFMTISTIPTWSGKKIGARVPREKVIPVSVAVVLFTATLVSYPFPILTLMTVGYLVAIPFGWRSYRRHLAEDAAAAAATTPVPAGAPEDEEEEGEA